MKIITYSFLLGLLLSGCNTLKKITFAPTQSFNEKQASDSLRIAFNGTACFYIQYAGSAILTDPFMSNPSFGKVTFGNIKCDTVLLNRFKPKTHNIKLLAIGHAHYDHILDLPYFANKINSDAKIVGSPNAIALANTLNVSNPRINIAELKAHDSTAGTWIYAADSSMRIMAAQSAHLPHILGIHLYDGKYKSALTAYPTKAKRFLQDETLAYLIDYLDASLQPQKRIYFSSSSVSYPNGYFPQQIINEKAIDVAILSTALFQKAKGYPHDLIYYLKPKHTILCHWENFFRTRDKKLKPVSLTRHKKMFQAIKDLKPYTQFHHIKPGSGWMIQ